MFRNWYSAFCKLSFISKLWCPFLLIFAKKSLNNTAFGKIKSNTLKIKAKKCIYIFYSKMLCKWSLLFIKYFNMPSSVMEQMTCLSTRPLHITSKMWHNIEKRNIQSDLIQDWGEESKEDNSLSFKARILKKKSIVNVLLFVFHFWKRSASNFSSRY